jgi:ATP-dependent HslUV protease subunit HslV
MMGDGMVSMGNLTIKPNAKKIRRIEPSATATQNVESSSSSEDGDGETAEEKNKNNCTLVGFAGSTADAFTLMERLEGKLDEYPGQLTRSCVELAKGWRTDKYLRRLEASLLVADKSKSFELTGNGDVLESHDDVLSVGSGSPFALAAARALMSTNPDMSSEEVARRSLEIASDMCVYTNKEFTVETINSVEVAEEA